MRLSKWSLIIIVAACATVFARERMVQADQNNLGIYRNETRELYEQPITTVSRGTNLTILDTRPPHYRVRTPSGEEGWVERRLVSAVSSAATGPTSRAFVFDDADIVGYLDNPAPVFIMDTDDPGSDPITLDRSFKDALKQNIDRETMERLTR
ncbi:hypothetical protein CHISP_1446 [Chitinispirillum alkaliphilum]|nr:hypothetical protein CHISP_1446 [Chitinispirillum alkaliphilum]